MLSLQDAKNRFSAVVEAALQGRPQEVSRRGQLAVVVLAASEYARLVAAAGQAGRRPDFVAHLLSQPVDPDADADAVFERTRAAPRDVAF